MIQNLRDLFCLEQKAVSPFTDTSLAFTVVNFWGQRGAHSLPSDSVVLVTAFNCSTHWPHLMDHFLNQVSGCSA